MKMCNLLWLALMYFSSVSSYLFFQVNTHFEITHKWSSFCQSALFLKTQAFSKCYDIILYFFWIWFWKSLSRWDAMFWRMGGRKAAGKQIGLWCTWGESLSITESFGLWLSAGKLLISRCFWHWNFWRVAMGFLVVQQQLHLFLFSYFIWTIGNVPLDIWSQDTGFCIQLGIFPALCPHPVNLDSWFYHTV